MTAGGRNALTAPHGSSRPDQTPRLREFRRRYPRIKVELIRSGGVWQARIPEDAGEMILTRYEVGDLLGKLAEMGYPA